MKDNFDSEKEGIVSIWVGKFSSQYEFDAFFEEKIDENAEISTPLNKFAEVIGIGFYDHDLQEANYFGNELLSVKEILSPFSYADSFLESAVRSAEQKQIQRANIGILLFDFLYEENSVKTDKIVFIGSFEYQKTS